MTNERWRYYGFELRRLRAQAGLTQRQLGNRVGLSHAMIGALERAIRVPTRDYSGTFDTVLATGGALIRIWNDVSGRRDVPEVVAKDVETRTGRLPIVLEKGALMTFVIPESVLRHQIGGAAMMQRQLGHIADKAEAGEVIVQVLTSAPCLAVRHPFRLMVLEKQTVGYAESADGGVLVDHPDRVARLTSRFVRLQSEALPPGHSVKLIRKLEETYASAVENE